MWAIPVLMLRRALRRPVDAAALATKCLLHKNYCKLQIANCKLQIEQQKSVN
jgi:hypothetical protein